MKLKYIFSISISILLLASCTTERKCARKYPPQIVTKDSIIIRDVIKKIIIRDTFLIKGDTVKLADNVFITNGLVNSKQLFAKTAYANAKAQVVNSKLLLQLIQNDTAIARLLKENVIIQEKAVYKTETIIKKEFIRHWYDPYAQAIAGFYIILTLLFIALKIVKP